MNTKQYKHNRRIRADFKRPRLAGERGGERQSCMRCDYDPSGDFTGKTFRIIEVVPQVFEPGALFTDTRTGERSVMKRHGLVLTTAEKRI
jgi:hypothetical protein